MNGMWRDIRYALRRLTGSPGFVTATVLTLLLGIGGAISILRAPEVALRQRSLQFPRSVDPGFRTERIATLDLSLPPAHEEADKIRRVVFLDELFTRLRALPGIVEVGGTVCMPLTDRDRNEAFAQSNAGEVFPITEKEFGKLFNNRILADHEVYCAATTGYFKALGIPLLRGRLFDARDTLNAPHVALISESLARLKWPGQNPIGKQLEFGNMDGDSRLLTIVGIVGDAHADYLETPAGPTVYVNYAQRPQSTQNFTVVMRSNGEVASLFPSPYRVCRPDQADILRNE
ncbi:MAG TPA: ABC transporter permease [Candidatus Acidoferrum sp.]|nr:ABC transporter permease [Candidatus Acidoferrum sp.]